MQSQDLTYFNELKKEVIRVFLEGNPVLNEDVTAWSGYEITMFQEDFMQKLKAGFSEKWFYTYFKNESDKLPRIDMLNMMSRYAGYANFCDFKDRKNSIQSLTADEPEVSVPEKPIVSDKEKGGFNLSKRTGLIAAMVLLPVAGWGLLQQLKPAQNEFRFCFLEKSNGQPPKTPLFITVLLENESPLQFQTDSLSCFKYTTENESIKFVVQSAFHEPDTIVRNIDSKSDEQIHLRSNDHALMLKYYTSGDVKNWEKRRSNLNRLIADDADIYRFFPNQGISVYNKNEFINQLTLPTDNIDQMEIIETRIRDGQIVLIKFRISE